MAHPTRTGDLVVFAVPALPVRRGDPGHARRAVALLRPARLRAGRAGPRRQHQHAGDVPRRRHGHRTRARSRPGRSTSPRRSRSCSASPSRSTARAGCCSRSSRAATAYTPVIDRRAQRLPRPARPDDARLRRRHQRPRRRCGPTSRRCSTRSGQPARPGPAPGRRRQRRRLAAELRRCSRTCRRSTSRTPGAWTPRRTATTSSTTASTGCSPQQARADFPFLATNIVDDRDRRGARPGSRPSKVFTVNGVKVGVIGAELEETPELVSAGATAGLTFLDEAPRIKAESERLRRRGVKVQVVVIHQGTASGHERRRQHAGRALGRPDPRPSPTPCRARRSTR